MRARTPCASTPSLSTMTRTRRSRSNGSSTPPRSNRTAAVTKSGADLDARRGRHVGGHEEVRHERAGGVDAVLLEIALALAVEEGVVDQEIAAELARRLVEDGVGGVGHDVGGAALAQALVAGQRELDRRRGDTGARPEGVEGDAFVLELGCHAE